MVRWWWPCLLEIHHFNNDWYSVILAAELLFRLQTKGDSRDINDCYHLLNRDLPECEKKWRLKNENNFNFIIEFIVATRIAINIIITTLHVCRISNNTSSIFLQNEIKYYFLIRITYPSLTHNLLPPYLHTSIHLQNQISISLPQPYHLFLTNRTKYSPHIPNSHLTTPIVILPSAPWRVYHIRINPLSNQNTCADTAPLQSHAS